MLKARGDEEDRIQGLELGADDYLVKPFSPRELVSRVRAILRRVENQEAGSGQTSTGSLSGAGKPVFSFPSLSVDLLASRIELNTSKAPPPPTQSLILPLLS